MNRDLITRALWTFVQAAAAYLLVADTGGWRVLLAGALGAGLSAVKTIVIGTPSAGDAEDADDA